MKITARLNHIFNYFFIVFWSALSLVCIFNQVPAFAADNLLLAPERVIFEGKTRATTVKLINPSRKPVRAIISIVTTRMDEHGKITVAKEPDESELFAQKMIKFSPKRATIPARDVQIIRMMVRKPKDLPPGEYRSQLRCLPDMPIDTKEKNAQQNSVGVNIRLVFAISIPVIVRHGEGSVDIIPHTPKLITKNGDEFLKVNLERTGIFSSYFNAIAFFTPSGETQKIFIGKNNGLGIYAKNKNYNIQIPVKDKAILNHGKIEIEIRDREKPGNALINSKSFEWK